MQPTIEIKVFVSCPGDVTPEKDMIKAICEMTNNTLMLTKSPFRLKVLDFRDIVGSVSGRAQEEINNRFSDYDIYIGMLWMRFGTPSGASDPVTGKEYESGTEEEFRIAQKIHEGGRTIKMYLFFKDPDVSKSISETRQLLKVQEFKDNVQHLGWVNTFPNESRSLEFNNKIHGVLYEWVREVENKEWIEEKNKYIEKLPDDSDSAFKEIAKFVMKAPQFIKSIPRTLSAFDSNRNPLLKYYETTEDKNLTKLVKDFNRIVVLGNAGSGKSTELSNLANFYATEDTPFIPVYQRLNTYVDEPIENFLPLGWQEIPNGIALVILDGLDEVQPINFNTVVRKIQTFSDRFPNLRIVVSCRTNFYDFPDAATGGTLSGFNVYFIDEIKKNNISDYAIAKFHIDPAKFLQEISNEGLDEVAQQPFFLNILLAEFKKSGNLKIDKIELLERFISERITFDQAHFKLTIQLKNKKFSIMQLLKKVALAMEFLGRNFLKYDELLQLLPNSSDVDLIKYSTAFKNFENENDKWGFEHNNIQEFLAASALKDLNTQDIKAFITFDDKKIKPSWLNTVFFLMSLLEEEKRIELTKWILEVDPEVLIKIEPDKVNAETRFNIFKHIFEHYKAQGVWLRSNKFTSRELGRFVPAGTGNTYLLEQLNLEENDKVVKMNAIDILKSQELNSEQLQSTTTQFIKFIEDNPNDHYIFHSSTGALSLLKTVDKTIIDKLLSSFGHRKNQYIRSGFYNMMIKAELVDEYIDYFLEGLSIAHHGEDRDGIHLLDESMLIQEALSGNLNYNSLLKVLIIFENSSKKGMMALRNIMEILKNLIEIAVTLYNTHKDLYGIILDTFKKYRGSYQESVSDILADFFIRTSTDFDAFKEVFFDNTLSGYLKSLLHKSLLSTKAIDFILEEYAKRNLTNKDVMDFYNSFNWFAARINKNTAMTYLTEQLKEKSNLLDDNIKIDSQKLRLEKLRQDMEIYFSIKKFRIATIEFFESLKINEIDWDTLWQYDRSDSRIENQLPEAVFDLLVDLTRGYMTVTLKKILEFIDNTESFQTYLFKKLKDILSANREIVLSKQQEDKLSIWVTEKISHSDILDAIHISESNPDNFSYNTTIMVLWYLISRFKIRVNKSKLLDFTLYNESHSNSETGLDFEIIEELVGKNNVQSRVLENLKKGIPYDSSWKNNAVYALENSIISTYSIILNDLLNRSKYIYSRTFILKKYATETKDFKGLKSLLDNIDQDELRWTIVDLLSNENGFENSLSSYLLNLLKNSNESALEKFKASQYLTKIGEPNGTEYYLQYLINIEDISFNYYNQSSYLSSIKDKIFIPHLISLLEIGNKPERLGDNFNRLDNYVSDALYTLGLVSEENLKEVKKELVKFIIENKHKIKNVNFYYPIIDRMEYHFYLAKSQKASIKDAIAEIKKIEQR